MLRTEEHLKDERSQPNHMTNTLRGSLFCALALLPVGAMAQTVPLVQDSYVYLTDGGNNFGGAPSLNVGGPINAEALVQFDLTALPAAIAAALVHRDRAVVAIAGDGGFAMTMAELETAVREKVRLVAVVFDNERYGTIRMHQDRRGAGQGIATDLGAIDFAAIARACGARGVRVDKDDDFEPALRQALAVDRPTVIQLALDRAWVSPDQPAT
jgi:TPP-dependent 2-oxoacid decarboxylase